MAINMYKIDQTGPKIQGGGDQNGLINFEYQLYVFTILQLA